MRVVWVWALWIFADIWRREGRGGSGAERMGFAPVFFFGVFKLFFLGNEKEGKGRVGWLGMGSCEVLAA